jgi:hypothetical protein
MKWYMKISCLAFLAMTISISAAHAKQHPPLAEHLIHPEVTATLFSYKRKKHFTAVELGFTNQSNRYVPFVAQEIFIKDHRGYSTSPYSADQLERINDRVRSGHLVPLGLAAALGLAAIPVKGDVAESILLTGAAAAGTGYFFSKSLQDKQKSDELIVFENNELRTRKNLPPKVTVGGYLYFPPVKKPTALILISDDQGDITTQEFPVK